MQKIPRGAITVSLQRLKKETWTHKRKKNPANKPWINTRKYVSKEMQRSKICIYLYLGMENDWLNSNPHPCYHKWSIHAAFTSCCKHSCVRPAHDLLALPSHRPSSLRATTCTQLFQCRWLQPGTSGKGTSSKGVGFSNTPRNCCSQCGWSNKTCWAPLKNTWYHWIAQQGF